MFLGGVVFLRGLQWVPYGGMRGGWGVPRVFTGLGGSSVGPMLEVRGGAWGSHACLWGGGCLSWVP